MLEAQHEGRLSRALNRWKHWELAAIDEAGYVPLEETGAEVLFQVTTGQAEKAVIIITSNLGFSEWSSVIPNARLREALWTGR